MASRGELEGESSRSGGEESEEDFGYRSDEPKGKVSAYEKQRLSRIAENKARLESLGISKSAKALLGSLKRRGKVDSGEEDDDDDYRPGEADSDEVDSDEEFLGNSTSVSRKRKTSASKRRVSSNKNLGRPHPLGEDVDLEKAIALSLLQDSVAVPGAYGAAAPSKKRRNYQEEGTWKKTKSGLMSKMQITEDELVIYFYQFDEAGKGFIALRDLAKMATVHDFTWTDDELQDMIRCFDTDKDGKLSLDEFGKIVTRCRMLKES